MPRIITVTTQAELVDALRGATGGEVISLASGNYGDLTLVDRPSFDLSFASTVSIVSADPSNPAVVTGLDLRGASNISFENITFDYSYEAGQPIWEKPFAISGSDNVNFASCRFDGDLASGLTEADNGFPTAFGLSVRDSSQIDVTDCEVSGFYRGLVFSNVDDLNVIGNDVHGIRMDGMNFSAVQGVLIEDNTIHDFDRSMNSLDHSDMIQFWTNGTTRPSTDIIIRGNTLDIGDGEYTQSIFMRNDLVDRGLAGSEMFYQNILIENNVIINGHLHGITVGETNGLTIQNNSVLHSDGASRDGADLAVEIPRISVASASTDVTITHNATSSITGFTGQAGWTVNMNAFVQDQDPNAPGWYGDVFITSTLTPEDGEVGFIARPGGMLSTLGAGAPVTLGDRNVQGLDAAFHMTQGEAGVNDRTFDATLTVGVQPPGTLYLWDFGDGTTASGSLVQHSYSAPGVYAATLTVILPDGSTDRASATIGIQSPELIQLGSGGAFILSSFGTQSVLTTATSIDQDGGIQLGGAGVTARIDRTALNPLFGSEDLSIDFSLDADKQSSSGEIFRLHGSFVAAVNSRGELVVRAWSSEGDAVALVSIGQSINDGSSHDVNIRLEGGRLSLWIDGQMVSDAQFNGTFAASNNNDLTFGNAWNGAVFEGDLTAFNIIVDKWDVNVGTGTSASSLAPVPFAPIATTTELIQLQDGGIFIHTASGEEKIAASSIAVDSEGGVQLGGATVAATLSRGDLKPIFSSEDLSISFTLDADAAGTRGEVFRLHGSFVVDVNSRGELSLRAWSSEGDAVTLVSTQVRVNDGATHENEIRLEGGRLSLWVDGTMVADAAFNGTFADVGRHNLTFGNPWNATNFVGDLTDFSITIDDLPDQGSGVAHNNAVMSAISHCEMPALRMMLDELVPHHSPLATIPDSLDKPQLDPFTATHGIDLAPPLL